LEKLETDLNCPPDNEMAIAEEEASLAQENFSALKKPRAIVFKAKTRDQKDILDYFEKQFPEVQIVYVTTGPASCTLRVTKSVPADPADKLLKPYYSVE